MKSDIHPENYRLVIFHDNGSGERFLIGSTVEIEGSETEKWEDGNEYPVVRVDVSSASHPFYTGQEKVMDSAGRVERFKARASKKGKEISNLLLQIAEKDPPWSIRPSRVLFLIFIASYSFLAFLQ